MHGDNHHQHQHLIFKHHHFTFKHHHMQYCNMHGGNLTGGGGEGMQGGDILPLSLYLDKHVTKM